MCRGTLPLAGEEIQELKEVFLTGEFIEGEDEYDIGRNLALKLRDNNLI